MTGQTPSDGPHPPASVRLDAARVVLLAADRESTRSFAGRLAPERLVGVVWEHPTRAMRLNIWRRRVVRHGLATTASRLLALVVDHLAHRLGSRRSVAAPGGYPGGHRTTSVNGAEVVELVSRWRPTLVVVAGTTVLRQPLLDTLSDATVVNVHVGLTPAYRGTHGGAWAVIDGRPDDVAATVHIVDPGIDSGRPLVYLPVPLHRTMTGLAAAQLQAGLAWLHDVVAAGGRTVRPVERTPAATPLRYPPPLRQWFRFQVNSRRFAAPRRGHAVRGGPNR